MPNRIIKESICESYGLSECSFFAADLFKRLITYADDYGRFNSDTMIMRARLYPREYESVSEEDIAEALSELAGVGKLEFYTARIFNQGGKSGVYGCFPNWGEHQRLRDSKAKCPDPQGASVNDWYLRRFIPLDMRVEIIERDGFKCRICGKFLTSCRDTKRFVKLGHGLYNIDHIVPVIQGGRATLENLRLTCPECNKKRKRRFDFREILEFADLPQLAASCGELRPESNPNPIQSKSESKSESENAPALKAPDAFDRFWESYPKKVGKEDARKKFKKVKVPVDVLIEAVEQQKRSLQWTKENGAYIPNPSTWLNQGRWEDELVEGAGNSNTPINPFMREEVHL